MTERKPQGLSFESWIDRQIREAQDRGEFDNLPGAGKPLANLGRPDDEMWWIKEKLEREGLSTEAALPTPLALRKEIDRLPETARDIPSEDAVRDVVAVLNERIVAHMRAPSGPRIPVNLVDADKVVETWRSQNLASSRGSRPSGPSPVPRATEQSKAHRPEPRRRWWFRRRR